MRAICCITALIASAAWAQQAQLPNAAISGTVTDKVTGKPLPNFTVSTFTNATWVGNTIMQTAQTKEVSSTTDASGRYRLADLAPGSYRIQCRSAQRFGPSQLERRVALAGRDLDNIDFRVIVDGTISGKVVDENQEPVPNAYVRLISREYYLGNIGYYYAGFGRTDDRGLYTVNSVPPGHPYLLEVEKSDSQLQALSEAPLDPRLRKRVPMRTWYPNSPDRESAQSIIIQPGEHKENMDFVVKKSACYCIEGTTEGSGGPASMRFGIEAMQPSSGISNGGGSYTASPGGTTSADGKFRICDLYPGNYRLTATEGSVGFNSTQSPNFGVTPVTITDQDLRGVRISPIPGTKLDGEVVWDGNPPPPSDTPVRLQFSLDPLFRTAFAGERAGARVEVPGTFSFPSMFFDDYTTRAFLFARGLYIKDVTYAGKSVRFEPMRFGSGMNDTGMRVVIGQDGGTIAVSVHDKDNNPVSAINVLIMMADARSEGQLAATLVRGATDQAGQYTSQTIAPGKYYVMATEDIVDYTPECIGKLWRARNRFTEVDLNPKGSAQVSVEPRKLE